MNFDEYKGGPAAWTPKQMLAVMAGIGLAFAAGWYMLWEVPAGSAKDKVRAQLKDPASAIFERVTHFRDTGATCGAVNAKNSFGGYVGFRPFVLDRNGVLTWGGRGDLGDQDLERRLVALQDEIAFRELANKHCPGMD